MLGVAVVLVRLWMTHKVTTGNCSEDAGHLFRSSCEDMDGARQRTWLGLGAAIAIAVLANSGCTRHVPSSVAAIYWSGEVRGGTVGDLRKDEGCAAAALPRGFVYDLTVDWPAREVWFVIPDRSTREARQPLEVWRWQLQSGALAKMTVLRKLRGTIGVRNGRLVHRELESGTDRCSLYLDRVDGNPPMRLASDIACHGSIAVGDSDVWFESDFQIRRVSLAGGPSELVSGGSEVALSPSGTRLARAVGYRSVEVSALGSTSSGSLFIIPVDTGLYDLRGPQLGWNEDESLTIAAWDWTIYGLMKGIPNACSTLFRVDTKTGRSAEIEKDSCAFAVLLTTPPVCPDEPAGASPTASKLLDSE